MSKEAVRWAMNDAPMLRTDKGKPDTTSRHILAALAEHAHADGTEAYPSVPLIQYKTGYSRRTVQEALGRLEFGGLIRATGKQYDCTVWALAMHLKRPASDKAEINAETEHRRAATAERVRRHRAKVTPPEGVTVTRSDDVTTPDVTPSDGVSNAVQQRSVTPSDAPKPVVEPVRKSLSPHVPQEQQPARPAQDERETFSGDAAKVAAAWATARGGRRNPVAEAKVAASAVGFIAVGWTIPELIDLAEDMARAYPAGTDLAKHEAHWITRKPAASTLPPWCGHCGADNAAAKSNVKFRTHDGSAKGTPCPACHPDAIKDDAA